MQDQVQGQGPFGFNSLWDLLNGGGRGGNFFNPNAGYNGFFDLSGALGGLGGFFAGPLGAALGKWGGNRLEGMGQGGGQQGGGAPNWHMYNAMFPGAGTLLSGLSDGWMGGGGQQGGAGGGAGPGVRNVYVGDYGGVGDGAGRGGASWYPNFGGDDVNMHNPEYRQFGGVADGTIGNTNVTWDSPEAMFAGLQANYSTPTGGPGGGMFAGMPPELAAMLGGGGGMFGPTVDYTQFLAGGGGGGGGGGRGQGGGGAGRQAGDSFLANQFANGAPNFSIDPSLQGTIDSLIGQGRGGYDLFSQQVGAGNPLIQAMFGMLAGGGGPGGGGYSASGGGGGGGGAPNVAYRDLPPHMLELLENMRSANVGRLDLQTDALQDEQLASLFGRGVERSTTALDEVGRLNYGQGQLLNDINAAIDGQRLGLIETDLQSQTALAQAAMAASASRFGASSSAAAARYGSGLQALASMYGNQSSALASGFGSHLTGLGNFANTLGSIGVDQMNANLGAYQSLLGSATDLNTSYDRLLGDRAAAGASRYGSRLGFNASMLDLQERQSARQQGGLFDWLGLWQNQNQFDQSHQLQRDIFEQGVPDGNDRLWALLGMFGGAAGNYFANRGGG